MICSVERGMYRFGLHFPRRPNLTCHSLARGITWSFIRCNFGDTEQDGKDALKFAVNCGIAVSVRKIHVESFCDLSV